MMGTPEQGWQEEIESRGPEREALWVNGRSFSFLEIARAVEAFGDGLASEELVAGELVGLLAPPSGEGFVLIHALLDRGVVMVPLNLRWTAAELRSAIESADLRWLIVSEETEALGEELGEKTGCGLLRLESSKDLGRGLTRRRSPESAEEDRFRARREEMRSREAALVLFTSGTSGRPKGALLSAGNLRASATGSIELLGSDPADRWLCCLPLFHIGGLSILIRSVLSGTSVALHERFDAAAVSAALDEDRITRVSFVATMLSQVLDLRRDRPSPGELRLVLLGGGPASRDLLVRARALGYPVAPTYGLTEAASQVATRPPETRVADGADLSGGLRPLPGTQIRIASSDLDPAKKGDSGVVGEIQVRGPTVMQGYLDDPEATARVLRGGWLATGDLGRIDSTGGLRVLARRSDLIVSGGENIYPAEIESVLLDHPAVAEAGVVGFPDDVFGERPRAFLVAASGERLEVDDVLEFCRERLASYKVPVALVVVDELPRNASGKLLRRKLAACGGIDAPASRT